MSAPVTIPGPEGPVGARHWAQRAGMGARTFVLAGGGEALAIGLHRRGAAVLLLDELGGDGPTDRRCTAELDAAGRWLLDRGSDPDTLAIAGLGRGATLAFLTACQSSRFQAVVMLDGAVVYPELDAARPVQPHEMALNLGAPLVAHFAGGGDPQTPGDPVPEEDIALLRSKLDAFAKPYEVHHYPGVARGFGDGAAQEEVWERTWAFLDEVF